MTKDEKPAKPSASAREERLAKALRENLKRRKAQARARDAGESAAPGEKPKARGRP